MNSSKLYVGGLPHSITEDRIEELFGEHGTVESARVITDKFTGRSRGFGFVEMSTQEEAQQAIDKLNGTDLEGRSIPLSKEAIPSGRTGKISSRRRVTVNKAIT
ncbi:MAG: RNA-binding protein, partial [Acidobacteria bacterium]|nr:RNA-binding protein [Acidobacteriota bacterium]